MKFFVGVLTGLGVAWVALAVWRTQVADDWVPTIPTSFDIPE